MRLKLKTAPLLEPISQDVAKNHLKVDSADDNVLISALITTARQLAERETNRAFITQTWQMYMDSAPEEIEIPKPPLQQVIDIKVISEAGDESIVNSTLYDVDWSENSPGRVKLKSWCSWPTHRGFASFIIEFKAGYGDAATDVPEALKQGILQLLSHLYENREAEEIPKGIKALFWPFKILKI